VIQLQQLRNYFQLGLRPPRHLPADLRGEEYKGYLIELRSPCLELERSYIAVCIHAPSGEITSAFANGGSSLIQIDSRNPQATVDFCIARAKQVIDNTETR
jgi:hypothetical protein